MTKDNSSNGRQSKRQKIDTIKDVKVSEQTCCVKIDEKLASGLHQQGDVLENLQEGRSLLCSLIGPLDTNFFLEKCFRNCAVHISRSGEDNTDRFSGIREQLFGLDPHQIFKQTSSESIFVWLQMKQNKQIQSIEVSDPDTALALHRAGNATYCRAPTDLEQLLVPALLTDTGLGCGQYDVSGESMSCLGRGEIEVFLSTPEHLTDWHFDFQENFTLQLSGIKKWSLQKGTFKHPLRGCTPHYHSPDTVEPQLKAARLGDPNFSFGRPEIGKNAVGQVETVFLLPGDVLYHPAGCWHRVEAIEEGVSINISLMATTFAALTCQSLQHILMQKDEWRQCVCGSPNISVVDRLKALLKELPAIVAEFEQNGGAECILPPALRQDALSPSYHNDETETNKGFCDDVKDGMDSESYSGDDGEREIIDADEFAVVSKHQEQRAGMSLARNPLATLLKENEDNGFYKTAVGTTRCAGEHDTSKVFILNVNYAGSESHESYIRIRLRSRHWDDLSTILEETQSSVPEYTRPLLACLVHFGYLYWKTDK